MLKSTVTLPLSVWPIRLVWAVDACWGGMCRKRRLPGDRSVSACMDDRVWVGRARCVDRWVRIVLAMLCMCFEHEVGSGRLFSKAGGLRLGAARASRSSTERE